MTASTTKELDQSLARHVRLSALFTFGSLFPLYLFGAMSVHIQSDLAFGTKELGYAGAAFFVGGGLTARWIGASVDRIGTRAALRFGMAASFVASLLIAIVATSWALAAAGIALCGVSHAFTQLALNRMLVLGSEQGTRALAFGLKQAAVPAVSLVAGFTTSFLAPSVNWRLIYIVGSLITLLTGLLAPPMAGDSGRERREPESLNPTLKRLTIGAALAAGGGNALSLLIVDSFDANGFDVATGAVVLGIGSGLAAATRIGSGWFTDRRNSSGAAELRTLLMVGAGGFVMLSLSDSSLPIMLLGACVAFMAGWGWQGLAFFSACRNRSVPTGYVHWGAPLRNDGRVGIRSDRYGRCRRDSWLSLFLANRSRGPRHSCSDRPRC